MGLLQTLGAGQGYLKAGFLGFNGSGKTYTAILLAIGVKQHFGLPGPIAMYDTEVGSEYIADLVEERTGQKLVGCRSRSLDDLIAFTNECVESGVSVAVAESMTHPWRELVDAYLRDVNAARTARNLPPRKTLEIRDWSIIKPIWGVWADLYLNSPLHLIIAGRAGDIFKGEKNEETGRTEFQVVGVKMKTETEFGFEPSLLVEMEREQVPDGRGGFVLKRHATVIKDRFHVIDGATCYNPGYEFFKPHVDRLTPGAHATVDTSVHTATGGDEEGDAAWSRERRKRTIYIEEIEGELFAAYPGQKGEEKKARQELVHGALGTRSWTALETMDSEKLKAGLEQIRKALHAMADKSLAAQEKK